MSNLLFYTVLVFSGLAAFLFVLAMYPHSIAGRAGPGPRRGVFISRLGSLNSPLVSKSFRAKMMQRFVTMGNPNLSAENFIAYQELCGLLFGVLGLLLLNLLNKPLIWSIIFFVFGFLVPLIWLRDQIKKRHHKIARSLPYSIDLLTLSVEAGLDFQAAISKVVEKGQPGPLREELSIMLGEIRLGKTREQALRNLGDRVRLPQLMSFVSNLIQADRMGTSLGKVLRIQSTQMRIERTQRAEKLANEAPVKMLFPLVLCIFPTVFLILFGPIIYRLMG